MDSSYCPLGSQGWRMGDPLPPIGRPEEREGRSLTTHYVAREGGGGENPYHPLRGQRGGRGEPLPPIAKQERREGRHLLTTHCEAIEEAGEQHLQ